MLQGKRVEVGTVIELPTSFAAELKNVKKVEYVPEPVKVQDEPKQEQEKPKTTELKQKSESPKGGKPAAMGNGGSR